MSNVTALPRETRPIEAPVVEGIPLADLYLSDMNPRQEADPEGIALLALAYTYSGDTLGLGKWWGKIVGNGILR